MSWRISTHSPSEMENSIKEIRGSVWVSCKRAQMIWRCYGATCMGTLTYGVVTEAIQNLPIPDQCKETELFWSDSDIFSRIFKIVIVLTVNKNFAFQKLHVETISKKEWVENHIHTAFEGLRSYWQDCERKMPLSASGASGQMLLSGYPLPQFTLLQCLMESDTIE